MGIFINGLRFRKDMKINYNHEIPTRRNVLYMNDHHLSIPIQIAMAQELRRLYVEEKVTVMAFEQPYGQLGNYVRDVYTLARTLDPAIFLSQGRKVSSNTGAIHLLQVFLQQELLESRMEMWGVEDEKLFDGIEIPKKEYRKLMEMWKTSARGGYSIPQSLLDEWKLKKVRLEQRLHELCERRDEVIVQNIETLLDEKKLQRLPLVQGCEHFESIREKLRQREIGTVSYVFD